MAVIYQFQRVAPPDQAAIARARAKLLAEKQAGGAAEILWPGGVRGLGQERTTQSRVFEAVQQAARAGQPIVEALARRDQGPRTDYEYLEPAGAGGGLGTLLKIGALAGIAYVGYRALSGKKPKRRARRRRRY